MNHMWRGQRSKATFPEVPRSLAFLLPGDLNTRTGGYGYDRQIIAGLRTLDWQVDVHELDASFPFPTGEALQGARSLLASLPDDQLVMIDGLAFGAMPGLAEVEAQRLRLVGLVHHPLALESGLEDHHVLEFRHGERRSLATTRAVIVTSNATKVLLEDYGVPAERVTVIEPGTAPAAIAKGSGSPRLALLCIATLTTRKGHDVLFAALSLLEDHDWHLTCMGGSSDSMIRRMTAQLESYGIVDRVTFAGEGDDAAVEAAYSVADVFVLPTRYEGYGMVVAEALARGLPVISTRTGAIPELVGEEAGLVVPRADINALQRALRRLFEEPDLLPALRRGALARRETLPRWEVSCAKLSAALDEIAL